MSLKSLKKTKTESKSVKSIFTQKPKNDNEQFLNVNKSVASNQKKGRENAKMRERIAKKREKGRKKKKNIYKKRENVEIGVSRIFAFSFPKD
jgi:hypothetical protein